MSKMRDLHAMIKDLKATPLVELLFDSPKKKAFIEPMFGFILPMMLAVVEDLSSDEAFEFIFGQEFRVILLGALHHIRAKENASAEVDKLLKDLKIKVKKDKKDKKKKGGNK